MISEPLLRTLRICANGRQAQLAKSSTTFAVLCEMLNERGLVRTVKHRDHVRTYTPTELGKACLKQAACAECGDLGEIPALRNPVVGEAGQWKPCPACGGPWEAAVRAGA